MDLGYRLETNRKYFSKQFCQTDLLESQNKNFILNLLPYNNSRKNVNLEIS
jgi:hypothetical protein